MQKPCRVLQNQGFIDGLKDISERAYTHISFLVPLVYLPQLSKHISKEEYTHTSPLELLISIIKLERHV